MGTVLRGSFRSMDLVITVEHRFKQTPDGSVWTQTMFAYPFWCRYLEVFDRVRVVARVERVPSKPVDWIKADGADVSFVALPYYVGPWEYIKRSRAVHAAIRSAVSPGDAVLLRVPSNIGGIMASYLWRMRCPYAVEVVGDPYDVFAPGAIKHPLRPIFRWLFPHRLKAICFRACAAAYVTEKYLQQRYPPAPGSFTTHYSSVELPLEAFGLHSWSGFGENEIVLISVGSFAQPYKGFDVLIEAVALCVEQGLDVKLVLVGDGYYRSDLEALGYRLGVGDRVAFRGQLPAGERVRAAVDNADLFVLPSLTEGLPRVMIEAMARGLPCIGSSVGGIPELLPPEDLFPPRNPKALADKIQEVVIDRRRMVETAERNLKRARNYSDAVLSARRTEFYKHVRSITEERCARR